MGVASVLLNCRVFVLADPAVCSELLQEAIQEHLEEPHVLRDKTAMQVKVILHVLHAGLGTQCHSSRVAQALQVRRNVLCCVVRWPLVCVLCLFLSICIFMPCLAFIMPRPPH